mgnify:CR=1 FL=1
MLFQAWQKVLSTQECNTSLVHGIGKMSLRSGHVSFTPAVQLEVCFPDISWQLYISLGAVVASKDGNGKSNKVPNICCCWLTDIRLFIVDGIISLPVALSGFFILPDVPEISDPWYLTKKVNNAFFSCKQLY